MGKLKSYAGISRLRFLFLPVALVAAGTAAAAYDNNSLDMTRAMVALGGLLALHIGVNAINEASDARRGIDRENPQTPFSGGSGTVPSGRVSVREAALFGFIATGIGIFVGLWFLLKLGWVMLPLILAAAVLVIGYTDLFARIGLGEVAAGLGLGVLPVIGSALVQNGTLGKTSVAAGIISFMLTFNLLLLNEFPDQDSDRSGGRRNLVLMLGPAGAARIWLSVVVAVQMLIILSAVTGTLPWPSIIAILPVFMLRGVIEWARSGAVRDTVPPVSALGANVSWNLTTHAMLALGLFAAWRVM
jgi:1,4-dihydroxy-2-naphthoate octaprenyltransferase